MEVSSPTLLRRRLGRTLRDLRERSGMTGEAAGAVVERTGSWISRVEAGRVGLRSRDVQDLAAAFGLDDPAQIEELVALAQGGRQRGWWSRYAEALPEPYSIYIGLESAASAMLGFYDAVVPGLLQTEDYCRAAIRRGLRDAGSVTAEQMEAKVRVRMERQARLAMRSQPPDLRFVLDEACLYRAIGGRDTLREQLRQLLTASQRSNVHLRVLPFSQDLISSFGSYVIMRFPEDPDILWRETQFGLTYEEGDEETKAHRTVFERSAEAALDPESTRELIREAREKQR
jgi:transcriptional regulator with XRE-family HTH domain